MYPYKEAEAAAGLQQKTQEVLTDWSYHLGSVSLEENTYLTSGVLYDVFYTHTGSIEGMV